jgi:hypothetical protein
MMEMLRRTGWVTRLRWSMRIQVNPMALLIKVEETK